MSNNIEENIRTIEEKIKELDAHIANYEKINCKTAFYQELVKERDAIANVVNELKRIRSLDINSLIENYETGHFIDKDKIRDKINERQFELQQEYKDFKDDIRLNTLQEIYYME